MSVRKVTKPSAEAPNAAPLAVLERTALFGVLDAESLRRLMPATVSVPILAKIEGLQAGCIEALMLNHKGEVAECTGDNIFLVRHGVLQTPPLEAGILEGVTRDAVIEIASEAGIEVREMPLTKHDVYIADECFLTGTAAEIIPVVKVDNRTIGTGKPGPMMRDLEKRFKKLTQE